jgi:hypothetical protein
MLAFSICACEFPYREFGTPRRISTHKPKIPQPKTLSMDEYFKEDYKVGAVNWGKILGDLH